MDHKQNMNKKIRKGDKVVAIAGNNKGQTGEVLRKMGDKVIVQGLNVRKKHVKRSQLHPQGGTVELEMPIHISNLSLCNEQGQPVKVKTRIDANGNKEYYYLDGEREVIHRSANKS
ncbi:hypothetical protein BN1013_00985 [Candidatus Rubidus massiliensis]|nr:MAG: 50S ribosomal protein L24 [Chlamydia sp. 32-24]CDZ80473.1 hypothetical protein BN1013_00985 [Candidatus Rubidus massiliensis]